MFFQVVNRQSSVVNCRSNVRRQRTTDHGPRTPRSGISLTEVLISMGILTLGLLGVAALFPVGGFYMQKADISDRGSAIAQSVMSDIVSRGMLNPRAWYVMSPSPGSNVAGNTNYVFPFIDGKYTPRQPALPIASTFTRPFAEALSAGLSPSSNDATISRQFGNAYVIDPMYVAAAALPDRGGSNNRVAYPFPATAYLTPAWGAYYAAPQWAPWKVPTKSPPNVQAWPIRRVTFRQASGWPMDARMAEHLCRASDDLATEFPDRDDRPAAQLWDTYDLEDDGGLDPISRQWTGDYSWIATVVPQTSEARNGLARNPESFTYDVSVVVFYKRPLPDVPPEIDRDLQGAAAGERVVNAKVVSSGLNGGELLLTDLNDIYVGSTRKSPFDDLKSGQWIMLCGPHPNSSDLEQRFVLNWYQVVSIDSQPSTIITDPTMQRVVTVRGPKWAWLPATNYSSSDLSNNLCVGICRGAVAVHTKALRLEGPRSTGMKSLGSGGTVTTPNVNYPWY